MSLDAINLSRFNNDLTRLYLQGGISALTEKIPYFSTSAAGSGNTRTTTTSDLDRNSAFTLASNGFTPGYAVNSPSSRTLESTPYFQFDTSGGFLRNGFQVLQTQAVSDLSQFDEPIRSVFSQNRNGFDTRLELTEIPNPAPESPEKYDEQLSRYEISDANFDTLRQMPDFPIPRNGQGFRVFTNPDGSINRIETDLSVQSRQQSVDANSDGFTLPNRTDISLGATFIATPIGPRPLDNGGIPLSSIPQSLSAAGSTRGLLGQANLSPNGIPQNFNGDLPGTTNRLNELNPLNGVNSLNGGLNQAANTVLQRLYQLQSKPLGLSLYGPEADQTDLEIRQAVASNRSGYGVALSAHTKQSLQAFTAQQFLVQDVYAAAQKQGFDLSARMPMAPVFSGAMGSSATQSGAEAMAGWAQSGDGSVGDMLSKKGGSGGMMGFGLSHGFNQGFGNGSFMGGFGGGAFGENPFSQGEQTHQGFGSRPGFQNSSGHPRRDQASTSGASTRKKLLFSA